MSKTYGICKENAILKQNTPNPKSNWGTQKTVILKFRSGQVLKLELAIWIRKVLDKDNTPTT